MSNPLFQVPNYMTSNNVRYQKAIFGEHYIIMIITRLIGGLGNQMFQYAAGRSLAHRLHTILKLDISWFKHYPNRFYALNKFNILEDFASPKENYTLSGKPQTISQKLVPRVKNFSSFTGRNSSDKQQFFYYEPHFNFDPKFFTLSEKVYLEGYWQSEKYFIDIEDIIRQELTIKNPLLRNNLDLANQIQSCESVSLHIRRGDYVSDPKTAKIHGVCSHEYYLSAIQRLSEHVKKPHLFIFSDDPNRSKNILHIPYHCTIIDHNDLEAAHEDLRLMSLCKYHIIANSSLSWWGAWLNPNSDKIVITPKRWFNSDGYKTKDLIPDGWIRI